MLRRIVRRHRLVIWLALGQLAANDAPSSPMRAQIVALTCDAARAQHRGLAAITDDSDATPAQISVSVL